MMVDQFWQTGCMPRGYSRDLRERLLAMVASGLSVAEVARRTEISESSLRRWRRKAAVGASLEPGHSPGGPRKIGPAAEASLRAQVAITPDATLAEHCVAWVASGHRPVSVATMGRVLSRLGLPLKKRR
jgi:transposase-like protein